MVSSDCFYANVKDIKTAWYAVMSFMDAQQAALIYLNTKQGEIDTTKPTEIFVAIMGFQLFWHVITLKNNHLVTQIFRSQ